MPNMHVPDEREGLYQRCRAALNARCSTRAETLENLLAELNDCCQAIGGGGDDVPIYTDRHRETCEVMEVLLAGMKADLEALRRMDDGVYGRCQNPLCQGGGVIEAHVLEVEPASLFCSECKKALNQHGQ